MRRDRRGAPSPPAFQLQQVDSPRGAAVWGRRAYWWGEHMRRGSWFARARSLVRPGALPGWFLVLVYLLDWAQRATFVVKLWEQVKMPEAWQFLRDWGGIIGILWLTAVVFWPRRRGNGGTVAIHDLLDSDMVLRDIDLVDRKVVGPAILVHDSDNPFTHCTFDGYDLPQVWIFPPENAPMGAIHLEHCTFTRCRFRGVGWAMETEQAEGLMEAIEELNQLAGLPGSKEPGQSPPSSPKSSG